MYYSFFNDILYMVMIMNSLDAGTNSVLRFIGEDIGKIEEYIQDMAKRNYRAFTESDDLGECFDDYLEKIYKVLSREEMAEIKDYTGIKFRNINNTLRGNWNYDENGFEDEKTKEKYYEICKNIDEIFKKAIKIPENIIVYRGVTIDSFKSYGINSISELVNMKGQYMYEEGVTSTSLLEETSFFRKQQGLNSVCNILIKYYVPEECDDAIALLTDHLSYSPSQNELAFTTSSLVKVMDVEISADESEAYLKVAYIPSRIWEPDRKHVMDGIKR